MPNWWNKFRLKYVPSSVYLRPNSFGCDWRQKSLGLCKQPTPRYMSLPWKLCFQRRRSLQGRQDCLSSLSWCCLPMSSNSYVLNLVWLLSNNSIFFPRQRPKRKGKARQGRMKRMRKKMAMMKMIRRSRRRRMRSRKMIRRRRSRRRTRMMRMMMRWMRIMRKRIRMKMRRRISRQRAGNARQCPRPKEVRRRKPRAQPRRRRNRRRRRRAKQRAKQREGEGAVLRPGNVFHAKTSYGYHYHGVLVFAARVDRKLPLTCSADWKVSCDDMPTMLRLGATKMKQNTI